jgi:hypothetical protein
MSICSWFRKRGGRLKTTTPERNYLSSKVGVITYSCGHATAGMIAGELFEAMETVWPKFEKIYPRRAQYYVQRIDLVDEIPRQYRKEHPLVFCALTAAPIIVLKISGGGGYSAAHWYAGEIHNLYRFLIELPYGPGGPIDTQLYSQATEAWRAIP